MADPTSTLRLLHLVGSPSDEFYCDLSRLYARDCLAAISTVLPIESRIAYVTPDQQWRFPASLGPADIAAAPSMPIAEAIAVLMAEKLDVMLPQLFCLAGMTHYRSLFEVLQIPYIGNRPDVMALAAHKAKTKAIVAAAEVPVPCGELLRWGDQPTIAPPTVVKPASADNSFGVTLVHDPAEYGAALDLAFHYSSEVLVETFIPLGREVRCGVIHYNEQLLGLPLEEYAVDREAHLIRRHADKLSRSQDGTLGLVAKEQTKAWIVEPNNPITASVQAIAQRCHLALGCRHYSLFDFRIDPQGQPWFLEAGLYCSFSPKSVIITMAKAAGIELAPLLTNMIENVLL